MNTYVTQKGYVYAIIDGKKKRVPASSMKNDNQKHMSGGTHIYKRLGVGDLSHICTLVWQEMQIYQDVEICGYLNHRRDFSGLPNQRYECHMTNIGSVDEKERPFCAIEESHPYIWHTHPIEGKIYPSIEDLYLMINKEEWEDENAGTKYIHKRMHANCNFMVIFTSFGYWIIYNLLTSLTPQKPRDFYFTISAQDEINEKYKKATYKFYYNKATSMRVKSGEVKGGRTYDEAAMNTLVSDLNKIFKDVLCLRFRYVDPVSPDTYTNTKKRAMNVSNVNVNTYSSTRQRYNRG